MSVLSTCAGKLLFIEQMRIRAHGEPHGPSSRISAQRKRTEQVLRRESFQRQVRHPRVAVTFPLPFSAYDQLWPAGCEQETEDTDDPSELLRTMAIPCRHHLRSTQLADVSWLVLSCPNPRNRLVALSILADRLSLRTKVTLGRRTNDSPPDSCPFLSDTFFCPRRKQLAVRRCNRTASVRINRSKRFEASLSQTVFAVHGTPEGGFGADKDLGFYPS
ncbi:hypothetical protein C8R47DRAFT_150314 [Mycena vitilis]|nr:hypothetical protein C8R47DRAFT_150314 [Mycena vitilis]